MKKQLLLCVALGLSLSLKAQVYPYSEDFQAVTPTNCFGDCSGSITYLSTQGWTGEYSSPSRWKVNDAYGTAPSPQKGLGTTRFSMGAGITTTEIITPSIGDINANSVIRFDYKMTTGALFNDPYTLQTGEYVKVQVSVNGGTYTDVYTFTNANHTPTASMTAFVVGIGSFDNPDPANENVNIKFIYKRNDTGNNPVWIFTFDNLKVEDGGTDVGATALQIPAPGCGFTNAMPIQFKVKNYGGITVSSVPVQITINSNTFNTTVTETIVGGAESSLQTFNADLSAVGSYTISVATQLSGDTNNGNDTTASQTTTHIAPLPISTTAYTTSFETGDASVSNWTIVDGAEPQSGTARKWQTYTNRASAGTQSMYYSSSGQTMAADDWLISPCLQLQTGETYEVSYKIAAKSAAAPGASYFVKLGNSTSPTSFTTTIHSSGNNYNTPLDVNSEPTFVRQYHSFTVPANGIYYIAWHATSGVPIFADELNVDEVIIKKKKNTDVEIVSFDTPVQTSNNCYTNSEPVQVTIRNAGLNPLSNVTVTVNVTGAVTQTFTQTVVSLAVNQTLQVTMGNLDMTTAGLYTFASSVSVASDEDTGNDNLPNVQINAGASINPVVSVNFTGYTGTTNNLNSNFAGWSEKRYDPNYPTPGDGLGSYWFNTSRFSGAGQGTNAFLNIFSDTSPNPDFHKNDAIISPLVLLGANASVTFKAAVTDYLTTAADNMGSDDYFQVLVISNCGATQTPVFTISNANSNVPDNTLNDNNFTVSLAAYSGQIVQIAFVGSSGTVHDPQDYDFHIDDIQINGVVIGGFDVNLGPDQQLCSAAYPITLDCGVSGATSYVWKKNNVVIPGATSQTLSVTEAGTYKAEVTKFSITKDDEVVITTLPDATAVFTHTVSGLQVTFTNNSTNASGYSWNFGDGNTSNLANPTHTYASAGTYTVTLQATSQHGCANGTFSANITVSTPPPTALAEPFEKHFTLYPNPSKGNVSIESQWQASYALQDVTGKKVATGSLSKGINALQWNAPRGMYVIAIRTENFVSYKKLIIE